MSKPVPPEGPWRSFSVSLREADLDRLDGVLDGANRSEWARAAILKALEAGAVSPSAPLPPLKSPRSLEALRERALASGVEPVSDPAELARLSVESHAAQVAEEAGYAQLAPGHEAEDAERRQTARRTPRGRTARPRSAPTAQEDNCPHPTARVHRGLCGACGKNVGQQ